MNARLSDYKRFIESLLGKFQTVRAFAPLHEERLQGLTRFIEKILQRILLRLVCLIEVYSVEFKTVLSLYEK